MTRTLEILDRMGANTPESTNGPRVTGTYDVYFGLGHTFRLIDSPSVFKVSAAGLSLGYYLLRHLQRSEIHGRVLDMGTGSGVLALLLRDMGAQDIVASDVSPAAVAIAPSNEQLAFGDQSIRYLHSNLFASMDKDDQAVFDLVVFNPPGWRSPSEDLRRCLCADENGLDLSAMFYGDSTAVHFLERLPYHLRPGGRAIVGFNSLVGIGDVIRRHRHLADSGASGQLQFRLLERVEIPLLFYTPAWRDAAPLLRAEFQRWQEEYRAAYTVRDGQIYWYYEITEVCLADDHPPWSPFSAHRAIMLDGSVHG